MLRELIGYQLVRMDDKEFTVSKDGHELNFRFVEEQGDCCGWSEAFGSMLISEGDCKNPVITNVELNRSSNGESASVSVCFFGEHRKIAEINGAAGSGSGWHYGACVWVKCIETSEVEEIVGW